VERWRDSGLTAKEFAAELDVSPNSLTFWKWKLRQPERRASAASRVSRKRRTKRPDVPTSFLQLVPTAAPHAPAVHLELTFGSGMVVRVPPDLDEPTLRRLVAVLGGR
jgi:hypothetical protein